MLIDRPANGSTPASSSRVATICAYSSGKDVERSLELAPGHQQRRANPGRTPSPASGTSAARSSGVSDATTTNRRRRRTRSATAAGSQIPARDRPSQHHCRTIPIPNRRSGHRVIGSTSIGDRGSGHLPCVIPRSDWRRSQFMTSQMDRPITIELRRLTLTRSPDRPIRDFQGSPLECCAMRLRELNVGCFGGGTGLAEPARRSEDQSLAPRQRRRHDVRQRRQLGPASRRAGRAAAGRRAEVRAGAGPQRGRGATRAAGAPADARARTSRRAIPAATCCSR